MAKAYLEIDYVDANDIDRTARAALYDPESDEIILFAWEVREGVDVRGGVDWDDCLHTIDDHPVTPAMYEQTLSAALNSYPEDDRV